MIMNIVIILTGVASGVLALSIVFAVLVRKSTQLKLIDKKDVGGRTFYAIRLEGEDFLFLKDEISVKFVGSLDEEEDFKVLNLYEMKSEKESSETLEIPKHEKAS
jgi:hypothetical protein